MKRRGFTLIELLIVIAVLALLVALTTTSQRMASQSARTMSCRYNVKGLVFAMLTYDQENQSFPYGFSPASPAAPPKGGFSGDQSFDRFGWWWFNFTEDYYKRSNPKKSILRCPSRRVKTPGLTENVLWGNYGANRAICKSRGLPVGNDKEFIGEPLRSTDIQSPDRTLLIVDSGYSLISWWNVTTGLPFTLSDRGPDASYIPGLDINVSRTVLPGCDQDAVLGRHPNKAVIAGFAGGQVDRMKAQDFLVEKTTDDNWTRKPLWWPKTLKTKNGLP